MPPPFVPSYPAPDIPSFAYSYVTIVFMQYGGLLAVRNRRVSILQSNPLWGPRKNLVYSLYGAFACIGYYVGILAGALAAQFLTWRWYFWIGALIGSGRATTEDPLQGSCVGITS